MKSSTCSISWRALVCFALYFNVFGAAQNVAPAAYRHIFMFTLKKGIKRDIVSQYFNVQFNQFRQKFRDNINSYTVSTKMDINWFKAPDYDVGGWIDFPDVPSMQAYFKWRRTNPYSFYTRNYIVSMAQAQLAIGNDYVVEPMNRFRWIAMFTARNGIAANTLRNTLADVLRGRVDDYGYPAYLGSTNYLGTDLGIRQLLYKGTNFQVVMVMDFSSLYNMQNFTQMFTGHPATRFNLRNQIKWASSFHYQFKQ